MSYLLSQLVTLAALGSLYALAAAGTTLVHAATRQFNLALGAVFTAAVLTGCIAMTALDILGAGGALALAFGAIVSGSTIGAVAGRALHTTLPPPPRGGNPTAPLVATIGLFVAAAEAIRLLHESHLVFVSPPFAGGWSFAAGDAASTVPRGALAILPVAAAALAGTALLLARLSFGRSFRAVADDPGMAALLGLNVGGVVARSVALGCALVGLAGALAAVRYGAIHPYMGLVFGLKALIAAVIGGVGSLAGAVLGGFLLAGAETLWTSYFPGDYRDLVVFAILIAVLIWRPDGLFARPATAAPGTARW